MQENEYTVREAAIKLNVRLDTVYQLVWSGKLAARKSDGRWLVSAAAIDARIATRTSTTGADEKPAIA